MKVQRPSKNKQTGNPTSHGYKAWDFDDIPDKNVYAALFGKVVLCKNSETRAWTANSPNDPYLIPGKTRALRTEDYGNYVKLSHNVDGKKYYTLYTHLEPGTALPIGTEVSQGQIIGKAGGTGNIRSVGGGDGKHLHFELRDGEETKLDAEFVTVTTPPTPPVAETQTKEQIIIDVYKALTGEYPTDDEKKWRLQENKNTVELIQDILTGDSRAKAIWTQEWGISTSTDATELLTQYQDTREKILEALNLPRDTDTETLIATIRTLRQKAEENAPQVIYRYHDKDFEVHNFFGIKILIEKAGDIKL